MAKGFFDIKAWQKADDLAVARRIGYLSEDDYTRLSTLQDETARVLWGFIRFKEQEAEAQSS